MKGDRAHIDLRRADEVKAYRMQLKEWNLRLTGIDGAVMPERITLNGWAYVAERPPQCDAQRLMVDP